MNRRDRHIRILENFGRDAVRFHRDSVIAKLGLAAFSDAALEAIARDTVSSYRRQQRYNREWRAKRASQ